MSLVFQNIDSPPPSPPGECVPPRLCCGGRTDSPGGEGDGGSIFWKMRDIGLPSYSNNISTHCNIPGTCSPGGMEKEGDEQTLGKESRIFRDDSYDTWNSELRL
jgi:hypothetical protein